MSIAIPPQITEEPFNLLRRESLQLVLLTAVVVAAFFVTRGIAASNRAMSLRDAAEWYERGERQLVAGDAVDAVESFRHATVKDRSEKRYVLALARALAGTQQGGAARSALLMLRESAPEDRDINLQLARLAADQSDIPGAIGYYQSTLYAPWPGDQTDARRRVRVELIRFLLAHDQVPRAISELVALGADLPDDPATQVEVGQLFLTAGDSRHALDHFQRALRRTPQADAALAGAGQAAFQIGDYPLAWGYLRSTSDSDPGVVETRDLVDVVLSRDPLAARIGSSARRQRLLGNLTYSVGRLNTCTESQAGTDASGPEQALTNEAHTLDLLLRSSAAVDEDVIESGVTLVSRLEREIGQRCSPPTLMDRALLLIAQQHGGDQQ